MKIRMRVLGTEEIRALDCVVLGKLGDVYPCIDNGFHLHCGSEEFGYTEMYSAVDWMINNRVNRGCKAVNKWLSQQLRNCFDSGLDFDLSVEAIFAGIDPSERTLELCRRLCDNIEEVSFSKEDTLEYARDIDFYLNQNFLRVRAGGKLNSSSSNSIYFRISSKDYDWGDVIEDFLWDTFKSIDGMPSLIWIGYDAETNPPEVVLFEGSPKDLFEKGDYKIFASGENCKGLFV